jgi:hypothetical protein
MIRRGADSISTLYVCVRRCGMDMGMGIVLCGTAGVAGRSPSAGRGPLRKQSESERAETWRWIPYELRSTTEGGVRDT